jgi:opacity protein-like surface antigen
MRMKWMLMTLALLGTAALTGAAVAQDSAPAGEQTETPAAPRVAAAPRSQTDIGVSGLFAMTSGTTGLGTKQTPSNGAGGMIELRHISSPFVGYELAFSYNKANQKYEPDPAGCVLTCQNDETKITGGALEFAVNYVVSKEIGNLRPFAVGGLGVYIVTPGATPYGNNTPIRGTYIYGGGVDYNIGRHLGVRAQFRGNLYKAPNVSAIFPATGKYTQSLEPMAGFFYRF